MANWSKSPTRPMITRLTPRLTNALPPAQATRVTIASMSDGVASEAITTTMVLQSPFVPRNLERPYPSRPHELTGRASGPGRAAVRLSDVQPLVGLGAGGGHGQIV